MALSDTLNRNSQSYEAQVSLFQLGARSICCGNRCLPAGLVSDTGLCQPTLEYDRIGPIPGPSTAGMHCSSGTSVEGTITSALAYCTSLPDQTQTDSVELGPSESIPPASHVAYLREIRSFRRKLPHSCSNPGELRPIDLTTHSSGSGIAGVIQGIQILFLVL